MDKKPVILIVDDEVDICTILVSEFEVEGFECLTAHSGNSALAIWTNRKDVDVIISDVRMPDGTGIDLVKRIKDNNPAVPIFMFVSGFTDLSIQEAFHLGAVGLFPKPFDFDNLLRQVKDSLLPKDKLWGRREHASIPCQVSFSPVCGSPESAKNGLILNLGRGGMLIRTANINIDLSNFVDFNIIFSEIKSSPLQGKGKIHWTEISSDQQSLLIGMEFVYLNEKSIRNILILIDAMRLTPFIPKDFT